MRECGIYNQCCGSGFYFLGFPFPDLLVRGLDPAPDPSVIKQKYEKILVSYCCVAILKVPDEYKDSEPDPYPSPNPLGRGTNPRIRTKMSQIRNPVYSTAFSDMFQIMDRLSFSRISCTKTCSVWSSTRRTGYWTSGSRRRWRRSSSFFPSSFLLIIRFYRKSVRKTIF